jgi:hypothetical protein
MVRSGVGIEVTEQVGVGRRFRHWAYLNDKGKKLYGFIFLDGVVPVVSMVPSVATIEGKDENVYLIYHEEMTDKQVDKMLTMLAKTFNAPKAAVEAEMLRNRIPLRAKYTNGAGTNHRGFF